MSETTLVGNTLNRDAWLLGHEITPNIEHALSSEEIAHYRTKKGEIVPALRRGFVLPGTIPPPAAYVELPGYSIEETDCLTWLGHAEKFALDFFGITITLQERFILPSRFPWRKVLPVFHPGLSHRQMVDQVLKSQQLQVYEYTNVEQFVPAGGSTTLHLGFIEHSLTPTEATYGLPPKFARHWFAGRQTHPISLLGYGVAVGLLYKIEKQFLDPKTATWFPENGLPDGSFAYGLYSPNRREVEFGANGAACENDSCGFREEIVCTLKP